MKHKYDNKITDYWMQNYCDPVNHMCTLCGQSGVIHSEGIRTPAGLLVGRANYCICPNGQAMREQSGNLTLLAVDDATRRDFERDHLHPYGFQSTCALCNPHHR